MLWLPKPVYLSIRQPDLSSEFCIKHLEIQPFEALLCIPMWSPSTGVHNIHMDGLHESHIKDTIGVV